MEIKVLGTGCCSRCANLMAAAGTAVKELGVDASVEEITDIEKIMEYDVMRTPALVVDGKVVSSGKVLSVDEVKAYLLNIRI